MTLPVLVAGLVASATYVGWSKVASNARCPASPTSAYGFGSGPAYLSGQMSWYAGGQAAILMVDAKYSGPVTVRASQLNGGSSSAIALSEENLTPSALAGLVIKERQHSVAVVSAIRTTDGQLELQGVIPSPLSRAWFGRLSTDGPGCFELQVDGTTFTEVIGFSVQAGSPPPG